MSYPIYDLICSTPEFEICGYRFIRECDYENKIMNLHQHQHTYTALWEGCEPEPLAKIYKDGSLILDILLLWSIWSNNCPSTGERILYPRVFYNNENFFTHEGHLKKAISDSLDSISDRDDVLRKKLCPALFLIQESNFTQLWESKILFLSPCIDVVSKNFSCNMSDLYNRDEIKEIESIKSELDKFIKSKNFSENVKRNAITPFVSKITTIGSPTAVDFLYMWVKWTLGLSDSRDEQALLDHCIAFNQFRNSVVHYAGVPNRNIKIKLYNGKTVKIPKNIDESTIYNIGIEYFYVFHKIIHIWVAKTFNIDTYTVFSDYRNEIINFIRYGEWRDENIFDKESITIEDEGT